MDYSNSTITVTLKEHMVKTYTWMALGVLVTFAVAYAVGRIPALFVFVYSGFMPIILLVAQFAVVIVLSTRLMKLSPGAATALYFAYAALTGMTFASLGYVYAGTDIAAAFAMAAVFYASLVVIGHTTKKDLTGIGMFCFAGLIALMLFMLFSLLFGGFGSGTLICVIGLVLFCGITAWDAQKAKQLYMNYRYDTWMLEKLSIYSALELYLDFINIFLYILRILGNRND